jgi:hypothetical protein
MGFKHPDQKVLIMAETRWMAAEFWVRFSAVKETGKCPGMEVA